MAGFNVLARSDGSINWDNLLNDYSNLNLAEVEIFPIPKELGFDQDAVGINVHNGYPDKRNVIAELKLAIDLFSLYNLKFTELYDGIEIDSNNVELIADQLLPPPDR